MKHALRTSLVSLFAFSALLVLGILAPETRAFDEEVQPERYVEIQIIPQKTHVQPGETIWIGVEHTIYPHWHLYWTNPGDSGLPISF